MRYFIKPDWPAPSHIKAFSTTRSPGNSLAPFASFNLAQHVGDNDLTVAKNRELLKTLLSIPSEPIWLNQVHGNTVVNLDHVKVQNSTADAAMSSSPNVVCAIMTADCLPILLSNRRGTKVAAIHAGWRGIAAGIIERTLTLMQEDSTEVLAWLGPAIGPSCFEVSEDVVRIFIKESAQAECAFTPIPTSAGKFLANIYRLAEQRLKFSGVTESYGGNFCTYSDEKNFYSYRRDQGLTGRMATLIWIS